MANGKRIKAQHAFNNDFSPARYNPEVAKLAWERTLALFADVLIKVLGGIYFLIMRHKRLF
jgi:dienelactone hydrolase